MEEKANNGKAMHPSQATPTVSCSDCGTQINETTAGGNHVDGYLCSSCADTDKVHAMMLKIAAEQE
jgi:hypothetical protein